MDPFSAQDLATLRSEPQSFIPKMAVYKPASTWKGRLNGVHAKGARIISVITDYGSTAAILNDSTLLVDEGINQQRLRIRSISGTFLTLEENDMDWLDQQDLNALLYIEPFPKFNREVQISSTTAVGYEDYDISYTDQNKNFSPVVNIGPAAFALEIDCDASGSFTDLDLSASGSFVFDSSISNYLWGVYTGDARPFDAEIIGSKTSQNVKYRFWNTGNYYIWCTITAANGKTSTAYRPVMVRCNKPGKTDSPFYNFAIDNLSGSRDAGYWNAKISVFENCDESNFPRNVPIVIYGAVSYGSGISKSTTPIKWYYDAGKDQKFVGWIRTETWVDEYRIKGAPVTFEAVGIGGILDRLENYPAWLQYKPLPTDWTGMVGLTADRMIYFYLKNRSTVLSIVDWHPTNDPRHAQYGEIPNGSMFSGMKNYLSGTIFAEIVSDRHSAIWTELEGQMLQDSSRGAFVTSMHDVTQDDHLNEITIPVNRDNPQTSWLSIDGLNFDGQSDPIFTGSGLNDVIESGLYSGSKPATFTIVITSSGTPDKFKWKLNNGAYKTGIKITGKNQGLSNGIIIKFAATTGHTVNDQWVITASPNVPLIAYAPGYVIKSKGGSPETISGLMLTPAQFDINRDAGRLFALKNNPYKNVPYKSKGNYPYDIAPQASLRYSELQSGTFREETFIDADFLIRVVNDNYSPKRASIFSELNLEVIIRDFNALVGPNVPRAVNGVKGVFPPAIGGTSPDSFNLNWPDLSFNWLDYNNLLPADSKADTTPFLDTTVYYFLTATALYRTNNFSSGSETWEKVLSLTDLPGTQPLEAFDTILQDRFILDPWNPKTAAYLVSHTPVDISNRRYFYVHYVTNLNGAAGAQIITKIMDSNTIFGTAEDISNIIYAPTIGATGYLGLGFVIFGLPSHAHYIRRNTTGSPFVDSGDIFTTGGAELISVGNLTSKVWMLARNASFQDALWLSSDRGATWALSHNFGSANDPGALIVPYDGGKNGNDNVIYGSISITPSKFFIRNEDGSFTLKSTPSDNFLTQLHAYTGDRNYVMAKMQADSLIRSSDAGSSWEIINNPPSTGVSTYLLGGWPYDKNIFIIAASSGAPGIYWTTGLFSSLAGSIVWHNATGNLLSVMGGIWQDGVGSPVWVS